MNTRDEVLAMAEQVGLKINLSDDTDAEIVTSKQIKSLIELARFAAMEEICLWVSRNIRGRDGQKSIMSGIRGVARGQCQCAACVWGDVHSSDCAVHNMPALPNGKCDCGVIDRARREK